jgi:hypothetical protein
VRLVASKRLTTDRLSELAGLNSGALYLLEQDNVVLAAATPEIPLGFPEEYRRAPLDSHPHIGSAITMQEPVTVRDTRLEAWTPAERGIVDARDLCATLANIAAVAIENARLFQQNAVREKHATSVISAGTPSPRPR